ncbi:MAG: serine hydrolase, partial [Pseudomonadales bacterium]
MPAQPLQSPICKWQVLLLASLSLLLCAAKASSGSVLGEQTADELRSLSREFESDAIAVWCGHSEAFTLGDTDKRYNVASIRKSLLSALYGVAIQRGLVAADMTLQEVGLDDSVHQLTDNERAATVSDLLKSRSGIYLPALGESGSMKRRKPLRGSYKANEHFYYNNWDFNALGVAFESLSQLSIGEAFSQWIAKPTGMVDFRPEDVVYQASTDTIGLPMFRFYMTARDLARFGALYANNGLWAETQVIPMQWINDTFTRYSEVPYGIFDG